MSGIITWYRHDNIDLKQLILRGDGKTAVIFFHNVADAHHAIAMGIFVRFCGYGQAVLELKRILKVVLCMDGQHAVDCPNGKVNEPHFGRLQGFAFNGVVQNISEQRENVHRFHKGHAAAIGNAGELYIVGCAVQTLIGQNNVQRFVACAHGAVVDGHRAFQIVQVCRIDLARCAQVADLVL